MKVILLENVRKLGSIGEIIDVKRGYARNYLISNKKALFASKENIKEVEKIKVELDKNENKELYGSVKPSEISKMIIEKEKIEINPSQIQPVKEIKTLGTFKVILNLHSEIQTEINIKVISEDNK